MKEAKDKETKTIMFKMVSLGQRAQKGTMPITASMYREAKKKVSIECWRSTPGTEGGLRYLHPSMQNTYVQFNPEDKSIFICAPGERTVYSIANRLGLKTFGGQ